jgi:hypothetical protein
MKDKLVEELQFSVGIVLGRGPRGDVRRVLDCDFFDHVGRAQRLGFVPFRL